MTYSKHSSYPPDQVEPRLREAAERHKFGILNVQDLKATLQSKGLDFGPECRVFDICNPQAAFNALNSDLKTSVVLPCRISVFSDGTGSTIATVRPTDLLRSTGLTGVDRLALEVEQDLLAIIDEAA